MKTKLLDNERFKHVNYRHADVASTKDVGSERARAGVRLLSKWIDALMRPALGVALVLGGLVGGAAQDAVAQAAAVTGVTYGQPKAIPGEFNGDLSRLPLAAPSVGVPKPDRPLQRPPFQSKFMTAPPPSLLATGSLGAPLAPMPSTIQNFAGLSYNDMCFFVFECVGKPPGPNGDVGRNHYIEAVNDGVIAIYSKAGVRLAAFPASFSVSGGAGATECYAYYEADIAVLYDWLADRFVLSWSGYYWSGKPGDPVVPSWCIAASKTSDPVSGGWWVYSIPMDPGTPGSPPNGDVSDNARFGLWHDCLYLGANEFDPVGNYDGVAFASFSRADLYSGALLTYALGWLPPASNAFAMVPSSNLGKGANAAQPATPNYFVSESTTGFSFEVRTFTPGPNCGAGGTLSVPVNVSHASYSLASLGNEVPQPNTTNKLDNIDDRILPKVQYRKIGGTESLWVTHNVDPCTNVSCTSHGPTAMQWAQIDVTGGTIITTPVQQQIYSPDSTLYRWMGSLAVDSQGNMALGYSTSNATAPNFPSIAYSGRLATDPPNTLPQTEVQLIAGAGSQAPVQDFCNLGVCPNWGRYSAMSLDPADDCTFWYVNDYYSSQTDGSDGNWQTGIGSFRFPSCAPPSLVNPGFEIPAVGSGYQYDPTASGVGWTFVGNGGIQGNGSAWGAAPAPDGKQTAFVQGTGSIAQTLSLGASTYTLSFQAAQRTCCVAPYVQPVMVTVDGSQIGGLVSPPSTSFTAFRIVFSVGTSGPHTLMFAGTDPNDKTTFIDAVAIAAGIVSTTALVSSRNPAKIGQNVTFTASVTGSNPANTVAFTSNGTQIPGCGSVALSGSGDTRTAACTTTFALRGTYSIVASYSGDGTNPPSTSNTLSEVITKRRGA